MCVQGRFKSVCAVADPEGGAGGLHPETLKNHKNIGFFSNTGPNPLKNQKATKPAFNFQSLCRMHTQRRDENESCCHNLGHKSY